MKIRVFGLVALFLLATGAVAKADPVLQGILAAPSVRVDDEVLDRPALAAAYEGRNFEPLWLGASGRVEKILDTLEKSALHGLNPADYHVAAIKARLGNTDPSQRLVLDLMLTDGLMRYASDVRAGRVSPRQVRGEQYTRSQVVDAVAAVLVVAASPDVGAALAALPPRSPVYQGLVVALAKLHELEAQGGWGTIPDGRKLEPGDNSPRVAALRTRLAATGELGDAAAEGETYDSKLEEAVKAYQIRIGMEADGVAGRGTLAMLNISVTERIRQVIVNMERMRWQPDDLGARHVLVNVPAYQLVAVSNGHVDLNMKVVVGRPARPTPVFSDTIRFVEFNPDWSVPSTIAREDIQPHLISNPLYALEHKNVRMYKDGVEIDPTTIDWRHTSVRQFRLTAPPGPRNPLGTVKFLFPNRFDVYLHDTSEPRLFAKTERAFSSGCVRVSDPASLSNWLLSDKPNWSDEKRRSILDSRRQTRLNMENPVPVYISYITAWLGEDGRPVFRPDIYNRDAALAAAIDKAGDSPRRLAVSMSRANPAEPSVDPTAVAGQVTLAAP
jgi:murein L,D-transpeptidase YcbB/YkuD